MILSVIDVNLAVVLFMVVLLGLYVRSLLKSPEGYEDDAGFHYGREPVKPNPEEKDKKP